MDKLYVLNPDTQVYQLVIDGVIDRGLLVQAVIKVDNELISLEKEKGLPIQINED